MIAKTLMIQAVTPASGNGVFNQICQDILASETSRVGSKTNQAKVKEIVRELVEKHSIGKAKKAVSQKKKMERGILNERDIANVRP